MTNYEMPSLSSEQRQALLATWEAEERARAIKRSLTDWARNFGFEPALHHRLLIRNLEQVATGEIDRLSDPLGRQPGEWLWDDKYDLLR
jgi:hypothetical protein